MPCTLTDLYVLYGKVVERISVAVHLRLEAEEGAVLEEDEVALTPVADVLAALHQPTLERRRRERLIFYTIIPCTILHFLRTYSPLIYRVNL